MKFKLTESQLEIIISKIENQIFESLLNEGRNEEDALKILKNSGIENYQEIFDYIKSIDKSKNNKLMPIIASFYINNRNVPSEEIIRTFLKLFKQDSLPDISLIDGGKVTILGKTFDVNNFDAFKNYIDHFFYKESEEEAKEEKKLVSVDANKIFENDKFIVYEAPSARVCIDLFGRDNDNRRYVERSFCIGAGTHDAPGSWYHTHRDPTGSWRVTFYAVVDKEKFRFFQENGKDDTSLINVVGVRYNEDGTSVKYFVWDRNNRGDGTYVEGFNGVDEYIQYLNDNGVSMRTFLPKPYIDLSDAAIDRMAQNQDSDNLFDNLTPKQKYKYVTNKANILTPHQMRFVIEYMPPAVIENFIKNFEKLGNISQEAFKLLNTNQQKTYINGKLIQLYNNIRLFNEDEFFNYIIDDNLKSYAIKHISNSLSPNSKHENKNRLSSEKVLGLLDPTAFLTSLIGAKTVKFNKENYRSPELPDNLGEYLMEVEELDISELAISRIPNSIRVCKNITTLHIHKCQNLTSLPNEMGDLTNLADLVVAHCGLESIPETIGKNVNLESFMVHNNNIKTMPIGLGNCVNLVMLDLSSNQIKEIPHEIFLNEEGVSKIADGDYSDVVSDDFKLKDLSFINMESNPLSSESENFLEILSGL